MTWSEAIAIVKAKDEHDYLVGYSAGHLRELLEAAPRPVRIDPCECKRHCKGFRRYGVWTLRINANGVRIGTLRCLGCGSEMRAMAENKIGDLSHLVFDDRRTGESCERCGNDESGVEPHHWGPKHLFADPDWWPVSNLCIPCHNDWHYVMTPYKSQYRNVNASMGPLRHRPGSTSWPGPPDPYACEHCNEWHDLVWHQWAPVELFHDSSSWPMSLLCRACSSFWSGVLETARLSGAA